MMSFKGHEGFGQVSGAGMSQASHGAAPAGAPPRGGNEEGPPSAHQSRDGQLVAAWLSPHATPHPTPAAGALAHGPRGRAL